MFVSHAGQQNGLDLLPQPRAETSHTYAGHNREETLLDKNKSWLPRLEQWFKLCAPPVVGQKYIFYSHNKKGTFDRGRKQKKTSRENYKYWDLTRCGWVCNTH